MHGTIEAVEYFLPEFKLTTEVLSSMFPDWSAARIDEKTGIKSRSIAAPNEFASDLAVAAAETLFASGACDRREIDFILLCTQSPDFALPSTVCTLQNRLGVQQTSGALEFNLGCSGFVYGLGLAEGLIRSEQAKSVLLITADTYSKYIAPSDKTSIAIFGDAAAATLIVARSTGDPSLGPFEYGTDGRGAENLIAYNTGTRCQSAKDTLKSVDQYSSAVREPVFVMKGPLIFDFATKAVPRCTASLLRKAGRRPEEIDLYVFHQANKFILEELSSILELPPEKVYISLGEGGNTISSTIPIALKNAAVERRLKEGDLVMLVGFGVGYSWGATLLRWTGLRVLTHS